RNRHDQHCRLNVGRPVLPDSRALHSAAHRRVRTKPPAIHPSETALNCLVYNLNLLRDKSPAGAYRLYGVFLPAYYRSFLKPSRSLTNEGNDTSIALWSSISILVFAAAAMTISIIIIRWS